MAEYVLNNIDDVLAAIDEEKQLDPGLISPAEKKRFVQAALDDLGSLGVFEKVVESTVSSGPVDLTTFGGSSTGIEQVTDAYWNGKALNRVDPRAVDRSLEGDSPRGYWLMGDSLYFYPKLTGEGTLTVEMTVRPQVVADLPADWRDLLVVYAVYRCHKKNGNTFSSNEYRADYENRKAVLFNKALQKRNQRTATNRGLEVSPDRDAIPYILDP